jgi:hypothetical protein
LFRPTTAELLIAARLLVTGKNKPVTGNHTSDGRINDRRWYKISVTDTRKILSLVFLINVLPNDQIY